MHPVILQGNHPVTRLMVRSEHEHLLHAGATLLTSALNCQFHIIGCCKIVCIITCGCTVCHRHAEKPRLQMMGQLPFERITPDIVFENMGIDYAGPLYIKHGYVHKPTVVKAYVCIFVSMSVKATHRLNSRCLHCCFTQIYLQTWETIPHSKWPWFQFHRSQQRVWRARNIPSGSENPNPSLSIHYLAEDPMEIHTRTISPFWRHLGGWVWNSTWSKWLPTWNSPCNREKDQHEYDESGSASIGLPIRKWPGVNISIPSASQGLAIRGRLLKHASICVRIVDQTLAPVPKHRQTFLGKDGRRNICLL